MRLRFLINAKVKNKKGVSLIYHKTSTHATCLNLSPFRNTAKVTYTRIWKLENLSFLKQLFIISCQVDHFQVIACGRRGQPQVEMAQILVIVGKPTIFHEFTNSLPSHTVPSRHFRRTYVNMQVCMYGMYRRYELLNDMIAF